MQDFIKKESPIRGYTGYGGGSTSLAWHTSGGGGGGAGTGGVDKGVLFDGTDDYLYIANHSDFAFCTDSVTIECWFNITDTPSDWESILGKFSDSCCYWLHVGTIMQIKGGWRGADSVTGPDNSVVAGRWHHVALVRNSTTVSIFLNGTSVGTPLTGVTGSATVDSQFRIGSLSAGYPRYFDGKISTVRVTKGQALYTSTFQPSAIPITTTSQSATESNVKLLCCNQSGSVTGSTVTPGTITANSSPSVVNGPFNPSVQFDGSGDKLVLLDHSDLRLGSNTYTMEFWMYKASDFPDNYDCLAAKGSNANSTREFAVEGMSNQKIDWYYSTTTSGGAGWASVTVTNAIPNGQWVHLAFVKDSNDYLSVYQDGTRTYNSTTGGEDLNTDTGEFCIAGFQDDNTSFEFAGFISNFRLTLGQVLYSGSSITVPTSTLTTTSQSATASNVKLLCCQGVFAESYTKSPVSISAEGNTVPAASGPF